MAADSRQRRARQLRRWLTKLCSFWILGWKDVALFNVFTRGSGTLLTPRELGGSEEGSAGGEREIQFIVVCSLPSTS